MQTGYLIEDFFPRNGVRYIAMNDGIDTLRENNDIAPFKNILNEMYSKDISKKVHSSYLLKAQKGEFTGCVAPFGYRKDPEDKNHLLVDEETAPIVRQIFRWALEATAPTSSGAGWRSRKYPAYMVEPRARYPQCPYQVGEARPGKRAVYVGLFSDKGHFDEPSLCRGHRVAEKGLPFQNRHHREKKPQDWIVVEQRHEPLIDCKSFAIVQDKLKSRQRPRQNGETSLFAGLSNAASAANP